MSDEPVSVPQEEPKERGEAAGNPAPAEPDGAATRSEAEPVSTPPASAAADTLLPSWILQPPSQPSPLQEFWQALLQHSWLSNPRLPFSQTISSI